MTATSQPEKIACPHCQGLLKAPALAAGALVSCPKCGQKFRLGEGSGETVEGPKAKVKSREAVGQESGVRGQESVRQRSPAPVPPPIPSTQYSVPSIPPAATASLPPPPSNAPASQNPKSQIPNPKPRSPDTIDPNLLPPPPPVAKPKPTQVAVVCHLCGTRSYAPLSKVGQSIKCPDCHTVNVVPALKTEAPKKSAGPSLEGTEDYAMTEVVDRPKYRPLQATRGEYEVLSALEPAAVEHRLTAPGERPRSAAPVKEEPVRGDNEEVVLAPPVERVEVKHVPVNYVEIDPADAMYDGRYDDGVIGDNVNPKSPDAWKKAPFVYGILEFLFKPVVLSRGVFYSLGLAVALNIGNFLYVCAMGDDPSGKVLAIFLGIAFSLTFMPWATAFCPVLLAIIEDTANGNDEVSGWPDWNFTEWFYPALHIPIAAFVSGFPGMLVTCALFSTGLDPGIAVFVLSAPLPLSWLILFPIVLYSMLAEGGVTSVFSAQVFRSFSVASEAWVIFYMYSIALLLPASLGVSFVLGSNVLLCSIGAVLLVLASLLYARLLGRLMWYTSEKAVRLENQESRQAAAAR